MGRQVQEHQEARHGGNCDQLRGRRCAQDYGDAKRRAELTGTAASILRQYRFRLPWKQRKSSNNLSGCETSSHTKLSLLLWSDGKRSPPRCSAYFNMCWIGASPAAVTDLIWRICSPCICSRNSGKRAPT